MRSAASHADATVFAYAVSDPHRYGIATFDADGKVTALEEKPTRRGMPESRATNSRRTSARGST